MKVQSTLLGLGLAALVSYAAPASATVYDFTFTGGPNDSLVSATGSFATNGANDTVISGSTTFTFPTVIGQGATLIAGTGVVGSGALSYDNVFPIDASA